MNHQVKIPTLGRPLRPSPLRFIQADAVYVPLHITRSRSGNDPHTMWFEVAGPRPKIFLTPKQVRAGIVTCGGLCPGLNTVIRSVFLELHHGYGVRDVFGFQNGYRGLEPASDLPPIKLTPEMVDDIHKEGGTILGTSRGPVDVRAAVDNLMRRRINMLFVVGGDGTQRGGRLLFQEARRRGFPLAVVGIPKTIDNDVPFVSRTFGYQTAVAEAARIIAGAHTEAHSVRNGVTVVKLMGRLSGFIAAEATVASQDVNFCLIPEIPFSLHGRGGFLRALKQRLQKRSHAVIVVAEGAGQDLLRNSGDVCDASGNVKLKDIGNYLCGEMDAYFKRQKMPAVVRHVDPGYIIRSVPANAEDMILCDQYARNAVHAAMAGKTGLVVGLLHSQFIHIPVALLGSGQKRIDPNGPVWRAVLATTGQPHQFN